jgi:tetratricopeptide (TPR) repeat protein
MDQIRTVIVEIERLKGDKKFHEAIEILESNIGKYAEDYRLYEELADIYLYTGNIPKAMKAVNFGLSLNPDSATGNYLKGFLLLSQDKVHEAMRYLENSNTIIGNNAEVLRNLGWAYTMLGKTERGIAILKRALNISPEDELIAEDLAMALIGAGEVLEGNILLKKISKKNSSSVK